MTEKEKVAKAKELALDLEQEQRQKLARLMETILESDDLDFEKANKALETANSRA